MIKLVNTSNGKMICEGEHNIIKFFAPIFKNNDMINKEVKENQIVLINKYTNKKSIYELQYDNEFEYLRVMNNILSDYIKHKLINH